MITLNHFKSMYGTGGIDIEGEWQWSGSYYQELSRGIHDVQHHYYISFSRNGYIGRTKGWYVSIYVCLSACNSKDYRILYEKTKTLKTAKELAVERINEFENSNEFQEKIIEEYLPKHSKPVFADKNGEPVFIGTTYNSDFQDMQVVWEGREDRWLYYHDNIPNYKDYNRFYSVRKSWNKEGGLSVSRSEKSWGGYSGGSVTEPNLQDRIIEMTRKMPQFQHLFQNEHTDVM